MGYLLPKSRVETFLSKCIGLSEVVAPVKTDILRFQKISDPKEVSFQGNPMVSIKKYLLPNKEKILSLKKEKTAYDFNVKKRIIFGARLCDTNALAILDNLYLEKGNEDPIYKARREATTIIGLNCKTPPSKNCFCGSMNLQKEYDLLFQEHGNDYYIDVMTEKGVALIKKLNMKLRAEDSEVIMPKTTKKYIHGDLWPFFSKQNWETDINECVSCQRCTVLCPTCFCFDLKDEMDLSLDLKEGSRIRQIDSCHSKDFTRDAGSFDERETRSQRYMHRVYHKLQSYQDKFSRSMCTGCGRCIDYCHSKIDFVNTANNLIQIGGK